MFNITTSVQNS